MIKTQSNRNIFREISALKSSLEREFQGQVTFCDSGDFDLRQLLFEFAPRAGPYQHAKFFITIDIPNNYPNEAPSVLCQPPPFHPNIDPTKGFDNICLNVLNNWVSQFGLLSLLHGLLFLFYEPNFESPLNPFLPRFDGLTFEQLVQASLFGGTINGIRYLPNSSWCAWARKNGVQLPCLPSSIYTPIESELVPQPDSPEIDNDPVSPLDKVIQKRSSSTDYFRRAVSPLSFQFDDQCTEQSGHNTVIRWFGHIPCTHLYSITLENSKPTASDSAHPFPWTHFVRYYFTDRFVCDVDPWIRRLTAESNLLLLVDSYTPVQRTALDSWDPVYVPCSLAHLGSGYMYLIWEVPNNGTKSEQWFRLHDPTQNRMGSSSFSFHSSYTDGLDQWEEDRGTNNHNEPMVEELQGDPRNVLDANEPGHSVLGPLPGTEEIPGLCDFPAVGDQDQNELDEATFLDQVQEPFDFTTLYASQTYSVDVFDSDTGWITARFLRMVTPVFHYLRHRWLWPFYQTRWPPFLAPGRAVVMEPVLGKIRSIWADSYVYLLADLFRASERFTTQDSFVLVDPLALSPCSPIYNIIVRIPPSALITEDRIAGPVWRSVAWISVSDLVGLTTMLPQFPLSRRLAASTTSVMFLISNWLAYFSRLELSAMTVGSSRPRLNWIIGSVGSTCLSVASLGCGQTPVLDAWPLWLLTHLTRTLGTLLFHATGSHVFPYTSLPRARLVIPFNNLHFG